MIFDHREQAGKKLAAELAAYRERDPLILAVPRGGVVVAAPVWENLGGELDLIITRKIGAPNQPELAIGAVAADGFSLLNKELISRLNVQENYVEEAARKEQAEIKRRLDDYRGEKPMPSAEQRLVILIDDGVATGYTLLAALKSLQQKTPSRLILAVPVGPPDTFSMLEKEVDELYYLDAPADFAAVGQFYRDFRQVGDEEVKEILKKVWREEK